MRISFGTRRLEKCYRTYDQGCREWGPDVARKYVHRVDMLQEAVDLTEIQKLPGLNCHPLKGKREGQFALTLMGRWRLIFYLQGKNPVKIRIKEVSNHYGD